MKFDEWVKRYLGKGTDYDGTSGVQCVDLIKLYIDKVIGIKPQSIGNAIEYYNKRKKLKYLTDNFTWIDNTPKFIPEKGDIAVFTSKTGYGHVSVCTGEGTTSYFYSYDQNYPSGKHEPMSKIKHTYNSFLGVLRPKKQENIVTKKGFEKFTGTVNTNSANLNIRSSAKISDNIIGSVEKGTKIQVIGESGDFFKVTYKNKTCYAMKKYIKK